jgi:hypothetical protein
MSGAERAEINSDPALTRHASSAPGRLLLDQGDTRSVLVSVARLAMSAPFVAWREPSPGNASSASVGERDGDHDERDPEPPALTVLGDTFEEIRAFWRWREVRLVRPQSYLTSARFRPGALGVRTVPKVSAH